MRLTVQTEVLSSVRLIKKGFTEALFLSLNPPFPLVKLVSFDGCTSGDKVKIVLNFLLFRVTWVCLVTEDQESKNEWSFVDEGEQLPFFLANWSHKHVVRQSSKSSQIIDDVTYTSGYQLIDWMLFPLFLLQFLYRRPIYKRAFDESE